jgi:hypothetical protein
MATVRDHHVLCKLIAKSFRKILAYSLEQLLKSQHVIGIDCQPVMHKYDINRDWIPQIDTNLYINMIPLKITTDKGIEDAGLYLVGIERGSQPADVYMYFFVYSKRYGTMGLEYQSEGSDGDYFRDIMMDIYFSYNVKKSGVSLVSITDVRDRIKEIIENSKMEETNFSVPPFENVDDLIKYAIKPYGSHTVETIDQNSADMLYVFANLFLDEYYNSDEDLVDITDSIQLAERLEIESDDIDPHIFENIDEIYLPIIHPSIPSKVQTIHVTCAGTTKSNKRCKNPPQKGSKYCRHHQI